MSDKKQQELNLGDINYISRPEKVTTRLIDNFLDEYGEPEVTKEDLFNILEELEYKEDLPYSGNYEGSDFIIVDSWDQIANLEAALNGWKGGKVKYLFHGDKDRLQELADTDTTYNKVYKNTLSYLQFIHNLEVIATEEDREFTLVILEDFYGDDIGFSDEYELCYNGCDNIIRTSPDCYSWTPEYYQDSDGARYCLECCEDMEEDIIEDREGKNFPNFINPAKHGLVQVNEDSFQNGLHYGMADDPEKIVELFHNNGLDCWFEVHPSQFYIDFDLFVREADLDKAVKLLNSGEDITCDIEPAAACEKALRQCSMNRASGDGVTVNNIDLSDGSVTTKIISKEDFIKGKI